MLNKKNLSYGVTLIELLIVVAIITLLFSIILISTMNARNTARDARIQVSLDQIRSIAEKHRVDKGNYEDFFVDTSYLLLRQDIIDMGGIPNPVVAADNSGYCVYAKMNDGRYCCIDNKLIYKCYLSDDNLKNNCKDGNNFKCE